MPPTTRLTAIGFIAFLLMPLCVLAQAYPNKAVHVIVVFPPGGSNDVAACILFKKVEDNLEEQFVIDNRAGASGTLGASAVARSRPDGYTLTVQSTTHVANDQPGARPDVHDPGRIRRAVAVRL